MAATTLPEMAGWSETWAVTPEEAAALVAAGEFFAAGFLAGEGVSIPMRMARGIASHLVHCPLPPYSGELLYPAGREIWLAGGYALAHHYVALDLGMNTDLARRKAETAPNPTARAALEKVAAFCDGYPKGGGYTHSIPNYGRVLAEGLAGYAERIRARLQDEQESDRRSFLEALLVVVEGADTLRQRMAEHLGRLSFADSEQDANRRRLAAAYAGGLPMRPARGFFEAMVATIFLFALDGSDNLGRFDQFMWPYLQHDLEAGRITREETVTLVRALWRYVDDCTGWNVAIGGTTREGKEAGNPLTLICLEGARGMRRPNLALRLRRDTPETVWDAALDTIATGTGLPALYCEENYLAAIDRAHLNLAAADRYDFAFGGCTELMVHGCSAVGSLDGDLHVIKQLEETLAARLPQCGTFEDLLAGFQDDLASGIARLTAAISRNQEVRGQWHPQLVRSLLIDDCIGRGRHYYDGGARYNWSVVNIVGLSNAIDSLAAVRQAVYRDKVVTAAELLAALAADFRGYDTLRDYLQRCPRFGNDDPEVDALAHDLSRFVYREFGRYAPWRGGRFICGTLMFVTYGWFGEPVGATPDGRRAHTPVADSAGPVQGRDRKGPTAMLRSVAHLAQADAPGTLVVNIRFARRLLRTPAGRAKIKSLIRTYFDLGGMQLQVNVVDQAVLQDALAHPERHGDLIVRVGGYSEYFNRLDENVRHAILERTEHA